MHFLLEKVNFHCHVSLQEGRWKDDHDFSMWSSELLIKIWASRAPLRPAQIADHHPYKSLRNEKFPPCLPKNKKESSKKKKRWMATKMLKNFDVPSNVSTSKDRWIHPFSWMATWHLTFHPSSQTLQVGSGFVPGVAWIRPLPGPESSWIFQWSCCPPPRELRSWEEGDWGREAGELTTTVGK